MVRSHIEHSCNRAIASIIALHCLLLIHTLCKNRIRALQAIVVQFYFAPILNEKSIRIAVRIACDTENQFSAMQACKERDLAKVRARNTDIINIGICSRNGIVKLEPARIEESYNGQAFVNRVSLESLHAVPRSTVRLPVIAHNHGDVVAAARERPSQQRLLHLLSPDSKMAVLLGEDRQISKSYKAYAWCSYSRYTATP